MLSKKEEIEAYSLIDDLRAQVKELSKSNSGLKNKLSFFKTLHEAETRKRTPYDHIPPRVMTVQFILVKIDLYCKNIDPSMTGKPNPEQVHVSLAF